MPPKYDKLTQEEPPKQWPNCGAGAGQFEYQDFDKWTEDEKKFWQEGSLKAKWGIGQVSIRLPIRSPLQFIAILYGYLPFIIPIWWFIWMVSTWSKCGSPRFYPTFGLCIAAGFALVNETITKKICRKFLPENITSRPPEAVCNHPGMPSGHVMNAYTLMVWTLLEVAYDYRIHVDYLLVLLLVMGPVPWARVYNKDHTVKQVVASMVAALVMGGIAFGIRCLKFPNHRGHWPWDWEGYHVERLGMSIHHDNTTRLGAKLPGWNETRCSLYD